MFKIVFNAFVRLMQGLLRILGQTRRERLVELFTVEMAPRLFRAFTDDHKARLVTLINGLAQELLTKTVPLRDVNVPLDLLDQSEEPFGVLPERVLLFESLYDYRVGDWHAPQPHVDIKVFDRNLYPDLAPDSVELETGRLYYAVVRLIGARTILETGVSRGYSTCLLAAAVKAVGGDGRVVAIDPAIYPHLWEGTDLEAYIKWIPKRSQDSLAEIESIQFDLLVIDSLHDYETCHWEVSHFEKLLKEGGYILMHDSLHYDGVGAVVKQLNENPRFETVTLPTPRGKASLSMPRRSGVTIVRKISGGLPHLEYDSQFKGWLWGDQSLPPFLWRT